MSGQKGEKDRPGFAAMLKAAHQRKFDILVFWALDRLTREGTRATLNYLQRLESKGVGYVSYQEQWLDSTGPFKDVMISMFATLAKQERARISERTIAGLKVAQQDRLPLLLICHYADSDAIRCCGWSLESVSQPVPELHSP
jgi:DNA invertase Pin-like site-specific DNA recombinase